MRNYRSNVKLQTEACALLNWLYSDAHFSQNGLASGAGLVEPVLAAAAAHAADADCANAVCAALLSLLQHGEWACAAAEQGAAKPVLALTAEHANAERLQANGICALGIMVQHADWAAVQAEAGDILAAAVRGLSAVRVAGSNRRAICILTLICLAKKDSSCTGQIIAAGAFKLTVQAMDADLGSNILQGHGCELLRRLAETPNISSLPSTQLADAQSAVLKAMGAFGEDKRVQRHGCFALVALQPLIRRRLCDVVDAARAKFPDSVGAETAAAIRSVAIEEPAAAAAGASSARGLARCA